MRMTKEERARALAPLTWEAGRKGNPSRVCWKYAPDWAKDSQVEEAMFVIEQQDRREGPLVAFVRKVHDSFMTLNPDRVLNELGAEAVKVLAQYEALDAKPEPTLAECQAALLAAWRSAKEERGRSPLAITNALDAWQAAVEREESKR